MTNQEKTALAIRDYCREHIDNFDARCDLAIDRMDKERIPIENADFSLANEVYDCISEWCDDHDCPSLYDEISEEDILLN